MKWTLDQLTKLKVARLLQVGALFVFWVIILHYVLALNSIRPNLLGPGALGYTLATLVAFALSIFGRFGQCIKLSRKYLLLTFLAVFVVFTPFVLLYVILGTNDFGAILIFLAGNDLSDAAHTMRGGHVQKVIEYLVQFFLAAILSIFLVTWFRGFKLPLVALIAFLLVSNPISKYFLSVLNPPEEHQIVLNLAKERGLKLLNEPSEKKNLVLIYLESLEQSFRDLPSSKDSFQRLDAIASNGVRLNNQMQVFGAEITINGMVASQCGIPLLPVGFSNPKDRSLDLESLETVVPEIYCLGDVLSDDGYILSYMNGADVNKFSKKGFLLTHGYSRLFDYHSLKSSEIGDRQNIWGLDDDLLFEKAHQELDYLAARNQPFALSILTISTHAPNGFLDKNCVPEPSAISAMPKAIECSTNHVEGILGKLEELGISDKTVVVLMSDHLILKTDLESEFTLLGDKRRNLFTALGDFPSQQIDRAASHFDLYPTMLNLLGYELAKDEAYFGVSAFSQRKNLIEELGFETLNNGIKGNRELGMFLWGLQN